MTDRNNYELDPELDTTEIRRARDASERATERARTVDRMLAEAGRSFADLRQRADANHVAPKLRSIITGSRTA